MDKAEAASGNAGPNFFVPHITFRHSHTWVSANDKNGRSRDWHIRDSITGHTILIEATRFKSLIYLYH
jgi:hypothetical protein